jgi:hypothetical protein
MRICSRSFLLTIGLVLCGGLFSGEPTVAQVLDTLTEAYYESSGSDFSNELERLENATENELRREIDASNGLRKFIAEALLASRACIELIELFNRAKKDKSHDQSGIERANAKALAQYATPENRQWWQLGLLFSRRANFHAEGLAKIRHPESLPILETVYVYKACGIRNTDLRAEQQRVILEAIGKFHSQDALKCLYRLWLNPSRTELEKSALLEIIVSDREWIPITETTSAPEVAPFLKVLSTTRQSRDAAIASSEKVCEEIAVCLRSTANVAQNIDTLATLRGKLAGIPDEGLRRVEESADSSRLVRLIAWTERNARRHKTFDQFFEKPATHAMIRTGDQYCAWWLRGLLYAEGSREITFFMKGAIDSTQRETIEVFQEVFEWKQQCEDAAERDTPVRKMAIDTVLSRQARPDIALEILTRFWESPTVNDNEKEALAHATIKFENGFRFVIEQSAGGTARVSPDRRVYEQAFSRPGVTRFLEFVEAYRGTNKGK